MNKKQTLKDLLKKGQVFAPCIYDCLSARAAEITGFQATLLSGGVLAYSMCGVPDIGLMTADELIWATDRIATYSPLPMIVDADDGYGETALNVYRTTERLVKAGAMGLTLDDTTGVRGWERWGEQMMKRQKDGTISHPVVPKEKWLSKVKASLAASEGSDCLVIARTECKMQLGLDEAIDRCKRAIDLGAEMTLIIGLKTIEEAEKVAKEVPGWKMWPDVMSTDGVPDVVLGDIEALGFNLVTVHYMETGAMYGMLDYGKHVIADKSTVYPDQHAMGGLSPEECVKAVSMNHEEWFKKERNFENV